LDVWPEDRKKSPERITKIIEALEFDLVKFHTEVDLLCEKGVDYLDAVIHWCEKNGIDIETIVPVIKKDQGIKGRLLNSAEDRNFIKKTTLLPEF
jgi:hypothetical protein